MAGEPIDLEELRRLRPRVSDLYLRTRVLTAQPVRLVIELYDAAILSLEKAIRALETGADASAQVTRTIQIVCELDLFLDFQRSPDASRALADVYEHVQTILAEECADPSRATLRQILGWFRKLREVWAVTRRRVT